MFLNYPLKATCFGASAFSNNGKSRISSKTIRRRKRTRNCHAFLTFGGKMQNFVAFTRGYRCAERSSAVAGTCATLHGNGYTTGLITLSKVPRQDEFYTAGRRASEINKRTAPCRSCPRISWSLASIVPVHKTRHCSPEQWFARATIVIVQSYSDVAD